MNTLDRVLATPKINEYCKHYTPLVRDSISKTEGAKQIVHILHYFLYRLFQSNDVHLNVINCEPPES